MSVRILVGYEQGSREEKAVMFDSVTGWAFGPLFSDASADGGDNAEDRCQAFMDWAASPSGGQVDARKLTMGELEDAYTAWLTLQEVGPRITDPGELQ